MNQEEEGKLAENILHFARTLRSAGLPVGTSQIVDSLTAVSVIGIESRRDMYWTLRTVLVQQQSEVRLFNQAFHLYFRNPRLLERMMDLSLPAAQSQPDGRPTEAAIRRLMEATGQTQPTITEDSEVDVDKTGSYSQIELLREKDFEQMTLAEQQEAKRLLLAEVLLLRPQITRRFRTGLQGSRYDLRRTMRQMQRGNVDILPLVRKRPKTRTPDIVLICDISGSMSSYSHMFLHFAHALARNDTVVHAFVFSTRLTNVSRHLKNRDADVAMRLITSDANDWDGGTRITACLRDFNRNWSRRVLARGAIVILMSDGLELDTEAPLETQMRHLKRSCRQLIWMNPVLRYDKFEPKASGIRKMLPHVDRFISAHNVNSISAIIDALQQSCKRGSEKGRGADTGRWYP